MLSRTDIRRECHRVTFGRGEELQQRGAVRRLTWEKKKEDGFDVVQLDATVSGSGEKLYEVKIKIDEDYREILGYECECPAFYSYAGMCKHCVAVLLDYLEKRGGDGRTKKTLAWYGVPTASSARVESRSTTFGFELLLEQFVQRDRANLTQREILGTVRLEPSFSFYGESLKVTFRIGSRRLYVVKNLGDFVNAVAGSAWVSYGKELAFYHHPEAFAPEYRPLVNFLTFTLYPETACIPSKGVGMYPFNAEILPYEARLVCPIKPADGSFIEPNPIILSKSLSRLAVCFIASM